MTTPDTRLDPEIARALLAMPRMPNGSILDLDDIPALRATLQAAADALGPVSHEGVDVDRVIVPRADGTELELVITRPHDRDDDLPALLWFHAGGQVLGHAQDDLAYTAAMALELDCVVVSVDYRLAPETAAPGAAEDGYLAYTHVCGHGDALRIDATRIGIGGASGGGTPAAATALLARDRLAMTPCLLILLYPMLDDRNETQSSREVIDVGVWDRRENLYAWRAVLGDRAGSSDVDIYSAPGRATDLTSLPPTFVAAAQWDVFRDEDIEFARKLIAAGVRTDLHVYAGAVHAWDRFAPDSELALTLERTWHTFARKHLHV